MSESTSDVLNLDVKIEEDVPENMDMEREMASRSPFDSPSPIGAVSTRFVPKYIIRNPAEVNGKVAVKRFIVGRGGSVQEKLECKNVESTASPSDGQFRRPNTGLLSTGDTSEEGRMRFWRTPNGKLVKLEPKSNLNAENIHYPVSGILPCPRPKFIRLANGKLARIARKRIPTSFIRPDSLTSSTNTNQFVAGMERAEGPSATAAVTSTDPIDVSTLMGNYTYNNEGSSLFEVRKEETAPVIKTEPIDEEEAFDTQQHLAPAEPPPTSQPSLAAALNNISASSPEVRDLVRIVDEPLFNPNRSSCTKECCKVCKTVLPGMKKHLLSVEARLGSLVDVVQNLIILINPKDKEAAEAAKMSDFYSPKTNDDAHRRALGFSAIRFLNKRAPQLLAAPVKSEDVVRNTSEGSQLAPRPGLMKIVRTVPSGGIPQIPQPMAASMIKSRYVVGGTRFIVADRARASRTVYATNSESAKAENKIKVASTTQTSSASVEDNA